MCRTVPVRNPPSGPVTGTLLTTPASRWGTDTTPHRSPGSRGIGTGPEVNRVFTPLSPVCCRNVVPGLSCGGHKGVAFPQGPGWVLPSHKPRSSAGPSTSVSTRDGVPGTASGHSTPVKGRRRGTVSQSATVCDLLGQAGTRPGRTSWGRDVHLLPQLPVVDEDFRPLGDLVQAGSSPPPTPTWTSSPFLPGVVPSPETHVDDRTPVVGDL